MGDEQRKDSAEQCERNALGNHLSPQPRGSGADGRSDGHFALPYCRLRDDQICEIDQGQAQHAGSSAEYHQQDRFYISNDLLLQGHQPSARSRIGFGILGRKPGSNRLHLGFGIFKTDAGFQSPNRSEPMKLSSLSLIWSRLQWDEHGGLSTELKSEIRRQNTDDGIRHAVELQRFSENVTAASELGLPETMCHERNVRAESFFVRKEVTSQLRSHAEDGQHVCRY